MHHKCATNQKPCWQWMWSRITFLSDVSSPSKSSSSSIFAMLHNIMHAVMKMHAFSCCNRRPDCKQFNRRFNCPMLLSTGGTSSFVSSIKPSLLMCCRVIIRRHQEVGESITAVIKNHTLQNCMIVPNVIVNGR